MLIDLAAHAGRPEEKGVAEESNGDVDVAQATEEAVAAEGVVGLACVAEEEEYKYDVADSAGFGAWLAMVVEAGKDGVEYVVIGRLLHSTYRSRLIADRCALPARP